MSAPWTVAGTYLEACNCESVCPCRSQNGVPGGDATYDRCEFALSWSITEGTFGELDLAGRSVVLTGWYADAEQGSPWRVRCFIDDGASPAAHDALAQIFLGRAGGHPSESYGRVIADVLGIESAAISLTYTTAKWRIGVAGRVEVRASKRTAVSGPVVCGIPGATPGVEYTAEILRVTDEPFHWDVAGRASFVAPFTYASGH
ncbi:MAG: DUF1326 domain-containing protein [Acidimicrobiales bacterium]